MEGYDASTVRIEDITTDPYNRDILTSLKENDPDFDELWVCTEDGDDRGYKEYCPKSAKDFEWLGYYIGRNTILKELHLSSNPFQGFSHNTIDSFCRGVNSNRSIQNIEFDRLNLMGEKFSNL